MVTRKVPSIDVDELTLHVCTTCTPYTAHISIAPHASEKKYLLLCVSTPVHKTRCTSMYLRTPGIHMYKTDLS